MKKRMWEIRQAAERGIIDLYIYGDVEGDAYDWWSGEVIESETSAEAFREELAKYPDATQINLYINSYGGSVFEGTAIYNQLKRHPAHKTVYVDGFACSIASVIAMAGDEIIMPRNTMMMVYNAWMGAVGNAAELRKAADDLETINAAGRQAYLLKAGEKLDEGTLAAMMDAETWLTAEECVRYGLADRFAEEDADLSRSAAMLKRANLSLEQRINVQKSLAAQLRELTNEPVDKDDGRDSSYDGENLCISMEKNADGRDLQRIAAELEYYRNQQEKGNKKPESELNTIMQMVSGFFIA